MRGYLLSMKKYIYCFLLLFPAYSLLAQTGYNIKLTLKPYKNAYVYLGYYYGNLKALADSVRLDDNSEGVFSGKDALPGGIYFVVSPQKQILFELLLDQQQHFSIKADTSHLPASVQFEGSVDNALFHQYSMFANETGKTITELNKLRATTKKSRDSVLLSHKIKALNDRMQAYRDSVAKKYPESLLTALFDALKEPVVPPAARQPGGKYDSLFAYHYYKAHYWDGVSFMDDRLVRTPFFEAKLNKYYKDLVSPAPDSIIQEVDHMLLYARSAKEMQKFLLIHFVQKYINPQYMGQDAVFVHLFEKYINTGQADFFTDKYRDFLTKRAYSLMANLIGQPAANMEMVDSSDKPTPLYGVDGKFIVICFWDPTCSHCKDIVPRVDSIFQAKWKKEGVKLYGVMVDGGKEKWKQFIRDNNLKDWIHVYQLPSEQEAEEAAGKPGYRQLYDVYQTPLLYLLDKDKRIIAKKLTYLQLDEVISLKLKNKPSN